MIQAAKYWHMLNNFLTNSIAGGIHGGIHHRIYLVQLNIVIQIVLNPPILPGAHDSFTPSCVE
jgi:hypothetical protein